MVQIAPTLGLDILNNNNNNNNNNKSTTAHSKPQNHLPHAKMAPSSLLALNAQQQSTPKRAKSIKITKKRISADEFAATWIPRFIEHDLELEAAEQAKPRGGLVQHAEENEMLVEGDGDDDHHLQQLDAVGHGLDLLEAFAAAAAGVTLTKKTFSSKEIHVNPFTAADALRKFIIDFLSMWQDIKNENYYHGMPRHGVFIRQFAKRLNVLLERAHTMAPNVIHKVRGGGGRRPRKVQAGDEDDDE